MTVRPAPARPRRQHEAEVVTVDAVGHYLAMISVERGHEEAGPWTLTMTCGMRVAVVSFAVSTRERVACSGCAQVGPPL